MWALIICFGVLVGFSMGLTGAGGSLLAIPMLVYGLGFTARDSVAVSLAAVGTTALIGAVPRIRSGRIDVRAGLVVAASGMLTAPVGAHLATFLNETLLLAAFSGLMLAVAVHMWRTASASPVDPSSGGEDDAVAVQPPTLAGKIRKRYRIVLLLTVGLVVGFLSGLFGVGGGFILVPSLMFVARMDIIRAVGTSLLIIFLVSVSGVTSLALHHQQIPFRETALFIVGGVVGLYPASRLSRRVSGPKLQRIFAACIVVIALFVAFRTMSRQEPRPLRFRRSDSSDPAAAMIRSHRQSLQSPGRGSWQNHPLPPGPWLSDSH
jgi:uncharacterized protein